MTSDFYISKQDAARNSRVINKKYLYNENVYDIFKYDKDVLTHDDYNKTGRYRSVIFSGNQLVVVSPSKSMQYPSFTSSYPIGQSVVSEELVEGTMINLFFDPVLDENGLASKDADGNYIGKPEIATRSTVGGNVSFYQDDAAPSFRRMFLEACNEIDMDLDNLKFVKDDAWLCYSFVLQHPNNRIVKPVKKPNIYLIEAYEIRREEKSPYLDPCYKVTKINHANGAVKDELGLTKCNLSYPEQYTYNSYEEAKEKHSDMSVDYSVPGVVFRDIRTGDRCKYRNKAYEEVRFLRGNQPRLQYQYLVLRQKGDVKSFLKYYPEKAKECDSYRCLLHNFTKALHVNYRSCYVNKDKPLIEFPENFRTHMYNLHQKFIKDYREKKGYVGMPVVIKYVNEMPVSHLMHALNYNLKKRHVANMKNTVEK